MSLKYPIDVPVPFVPDKQAVERRCDPFNRGKYSKKHANPMVRRESARRYWLIYSPTQKTGTGPFTSAAKAKAWYNRGGL